MPLTLEQYAAYLDTRRDLPWPAPPEVKRPKARPHLVRLPEVRCVLWSVYGTLLAIPGGALSFEHPQPFVMGIALEKTIQEFKMWSSMSRKPGQPSDYMLQIYKQVLSEQSVAQGGERFPDVASDQLWTAIVKKLLQKDYQFDVHFYGSLNELSAKIAYFFHASLQATSAQPGAAAALKHVAQAGLSQGLLGDGQCFTLVQLNRAIAVQDTEAPAGHGLDDDLVFLSYESRARKPSERLFRHALSGLAKKGLSPAEVLHVGSRIATDLVPARRQGMRTALYAGDRESLEASAEQLKDPHGRPDVLLTELNQIADVVG